MYLQKVISKKRRKKIIHTSDKWIWFICQRYGSADPNPHPDPYQNVMYPQHWFSDEWRSLAKGELIYSICFHRNLERLKKDVTDAEPLPLYLSVCWPTGTDIQYCMYISCFVMLLLK